MLFRSNSNDSFGIYPNPADDIIEVRVNPHGMVISIFTQIGEKVIDVYSDSKIDISGLSPGVYYIKAGENIQKFVKLKN